MSLTECEGVNLEKLKKRVKGVCEKRYQLTSFVVTRDDLHRQWIVCMSLSCPVKLRAAAVSFLSFLPWLLVLLEDAYSDHFMSTRCSPFWSLA